MFVLCGKIEDVPCPVDDHGTHFIVGYYFPRSRSGMQDIIKVRPGKLEVPDIAADKLDPLTPQ